MVHDVCKERYECTTGGTQRVERVKFDFFSNFQHTINHKFCTKVAGITGFKGSDKIKKYRLKAIIFRFVFKIDRRLPTCFKIFVSIKTFS